MVLKWENVSFVVRSKYRVKIILSLSNPKTPTQIAKDFKVQRAHISRAIPELIERKLIECLTPKEKRGRLYKRTQAGDEIAEYLKKIEEE